MSEEGFLSEKLDGVYSLVTYVKGEVRHWGRTGKALSNCEELDRDLKEKLKDSGEGDCIFISEITSEDPLAKLSGYLNPNRKKASSFTPTSMKDNFHDQLYVEEFVDGISRCLYTLRLGYLEILRDTLGLTCIPTHYCTLEEARKISKEWIKEGKEGGVFAQDALWIAGARNETLIKVKEKLSYDVTVVGVCSGKEGSKYEHMLGKLVVAFRAFGKPDGELITIPISGMTDSQRILWNAEPDDIIGQVVKMDAKSFTETGNLREPRFKEVRYDKGADFPVKVYERASTFKKGKATWLIHEFE